jgi:phosphatidate cytidylyltransferase
MKTRVISGIVLAILLFLTLFFGGYVTLAVLLAISLVGYHELVSALGVEDKNKKFSTLELAGFAVIALHYALMAISGGKLIFFVMALMILFMAEAAIFVFSFPKYEFNKVMASVFAFVYAPMMLSFIYLLRIREDGQFVAWIPFIAWVCDTSAYFAGSTLGKHKLCPNISPKKTVEGFAGGIVAGIIGSVLIGLVYMPIYRSVSFNLWMLLIIGALVSIVSVLGDLSFSLIKRACNIKDYGSVFPGHGGFLDRCDSVILSAPIMYFMALHFEIFSMGVL